MKQFRIQLQVCLIVFVLHFFALLAPAQELEPAAVDTDPQTLLRQAAKQWDRIEDYQALIHQMEIRPNGKQLNRWALVTLIKEDNIPQHSKPRPDIKKGRDTLSLFRLDIFNERVSWESVSDGIVQNATPDTIYYSDSMERLFTYKPQQNSVTIDRLDENVPIEEFLYLAGFAEFNLDQFFEEVYVGETVVQETIDNRVGYRIKIVAKQKMQEVAAPRYVWLHEETLFPIRFSVDADVTVHFQFEDWKTDQDLNYNHLIPEVPQDVFVVDHTSRHTRR